MAYCHEDYATDRLAGKKQACWRGWLLTLIVLIGLGLVAEGSTRLYQWRHDGVPLFESERAWVVVEDPERGWRATEGYQRNGHSQDARGYRAYGTVQTTKPKVLVVGDSFTHALGIADQETYYAILNRLLPIEVFAYGVIGYGTLQEAMVIERAVADIQPDLIVWQWCPNDFINNHPDLEAESTINNNHVRRPYLKGNSIQYGIPMDWLTISRVWAAEHTRFGYYVLSRLDRLRAHLTEENTVERRLHRGEEHPAWADAVAATAAAVRRARQAAGAVPIVAFTTGTGQPFEAAFRLIAYDHGVQFTTSIAEAIAEATDVMQADQAHWNAKGHALVGQILAQEITAVMPQAVAAR